MGPVTNWAKLYPYCTVHATDGASRTLATRCDSQMRIVMMCGWMAIWPCPCRGALQPILLPFALNLRRCRSSPEDRAAQETMRPIRLCVPLGCIQREKRMRCAHRPSSMTLARTLSPPRPIHVWMRWRKKLVNNKNKMRQGRWRAPLAESALVAAQPEDWPWWSPHLSSPFLSRLSPLVLREPLPSAPMLRLAVTSEIDNNFMILPWFGLGPTGLRYGPSMPCPGRTEVTVCAAVTCAYSALVRRPSPFKNVIKLGIYTLGNSSSRWFKSSCAPAVLRDCSLSPHLSSRRRQIPLLWHVAVARFACVSMRPTNLAPLAPVGSRRKKKLAYRCESAHRTVDYDRL
ncbi:hypothetical protein NM208_g14709 [Fusarium decemcellulare]|uniref:Uncharacterized protein n=1 Tax=Fusarium decemcellulare TaxID=57161 RepID=A0ACC1RGC0_9HYPO|nr:hypothetical protein NM208_g14709 [Fusarium decemcellulare]